MAKKLTTIEFIKKANQKHNFKYDYSLVEYKNSLLKVKIICKIHGVIEQSPARHLAGDGCVICSGRFKNTNADFIEKANVIHRNTYDYSLIDYVNNTTKVKIICKIHGAFKMRPNNHLNGQKCPECSGKTRLTKETFSNKATKKHRKQI